MRYYFDIFEADVWARDDIGVDCRNDQAARHEAVLALTELAREQLPANGASMDYRVRVRNGQITAFTAILDFRIEAGPALKDRDEVLGEPE